MARLESKASAATATVTNVNDPPTGTVTISGTAQENQVLTASNTLADADGLGAISYQWQRDGVNVAGATGTTYTLGNADVGHTIDVVASYTDGHGTLESKASAATAAVTNVNDPPTGTVTISGTAQENQVLTASNTLADADGLGTIGYQWQRDGVNVAGATGTTYTLGNADVGHTLDVVASYTDGHGTAEAVSSAATATVTNVNDPPTGTVTISGTAQENQVLTASNTLADADGLGAISYQWQRDGVNVAGATGTTYTLGNADVGHTIDVVASYTDGHGTPESKASAATAAVTNVNDPPTGTVTISGTAQENQVLTASNTLADADGLGAISYQWQRDGVNVAGATGTTYTLGQCRCRPHPRCGGELYRRARHGREQGQCGNRSGHQCQRPADRNGDDQRHGAGRTRSSRRRTRWRMPTASARSATSGSATGSTWPAPPAPPIRSAMPMSATPSMWWRAIPMATARPKPSAARQPRRSPMSTTRRPER